MARGNVGINTKTLIGVAVTLGIIALVFRVASIRRLIVGA